MSKSSNPSSPNHGKPTSLVNNSNSNYQPSINTTDDNGSISDSPIFIKPPRRNLSTVSPSTRLNRNSLVLADNTDQFSLTSTLSHSSFNSNRTNGTNAADSSLIFERLVQDPLTDSHSLNSLSLPRHFTSESYIPASLDTATHIVTDPNQSIFENTCTTTNDTTVHTDTHNSITEPFPQFGFSSRRSSLANLEAAFGPSSRKSSVANLQAALGGPSRRPSLANLANHSYRLNSSSTNTLSRTQTNSSFSNLTHQLTNNSLKRVPQNSQQQNSTPTPTVPTAPTAPISNQLPQVPTSNSPNQSQSLSNSPLLNNRSFCSYADIIAQDDQDSKYIIRRPSISLSLNNQHPNLARANSISSANPYNSPRSPSISYANGQRMRKTSPSSNEMDFESTPRRSAAGFSGRPLSMGGYSMRVTNSNNTLNTTQTCPPLSNLNPNTSLNCTNSPTSTKTNSQNLDPLLSIKKKDLKEISPQSSRSLTSDMISDDESLKSFKTANLPAE